MTPQTNTTAAEPVLTCGHPLFEEDQAHCDNCKRELCNDCVGDTHHCHTCAGLICVPCQETARQRTVTHYSGAKLRVSTEYLCNDCATKQDAAKNALVENLYHGAGFVIAQMREALSKIAMTADADHIRIEEQYKGQYPQQAGAYSAALWGAKMTANVTVKHFGSYDYSIVSKDAWLEDVIAALEETLEEAKKHL